MNPFSHTSISRRSFLKSLSAAATFAAVRPAGAAKPSPAIGVQLYTLRTQLAADLEGTLAAVHKIGIEQVEAFPALYQRPAAEMKKLYEDNGLHCRSGHFDYVKLEEGLDYAKELGLSFIVCSALPTPMRNPAGFVEAAARFNVLGAKAKSMGLRLGFHNHNFEFQPFPAPEPGKPTDGLEVLLQQTDPSLVSWEEDCYWVAESGNDQLAMLEKYKSRVALLHLKDRLPSAVATYAGGKPSQFFTEVGTGTIAWPPILKIARDTGALLFIEQDTTTIPPLESLAISYNNLKKMLA